MKSEISNYKENIKHASLLNDSHMTLFWNDELLFSNTQNDNQIPNASPV